MSLSPIALEEAKVLAEGVQNKALFLGPYMIG